MAYHFANRLRPAQWWPGHRAAYVMHGTFQGRFVALTIRIPGSRWVCHPHPEGDDWTEPACHQSGRYHWPPSKRRPPRHIRKAAKMALRRWLNP